jgi:hypothetical protein
MRNYEDLVRYTLDRCTQAQALKLADYVKAGWRITKCDNLVGYDAVVCICMQGTTATIDPMGQVTRLGTKFKTVSYKFPRTNIARDEKTVVKAA